MCCVAVDISGTDRQTWPSVIARNREFSLSTEAPCEKHGAFVHSSHRFIDGQAELGILWSDHRTSASRDRGARFPFVSDDATIPR